MNFSPVVLAGAGTSGIFVLIAYIAVFAVLMYFLSVRPQKETSEDNGCNDRKSCSW